MATSETLASIIESIVFVSGNPIAAKDIAEKLEVTEKRILDEAKKLQKKYDENSGLNLLVFNKKLQFCSNPKYAEDVAVVLNPIKERELSRSMLEVAAIIAYKQPVTRLDLEQIRGVDSEYAIQNLLKLGVIEPVGRKEAIGRPVLFGTTDEFLKRFEIESLSDLPDYDTILASVRVEGSDDSYLFKKDVYQGEDSINVDEEAVEAQSEISANDDVNVELISAEKAESGENSQLSDNPEKIESNEAEKTQEDNFIADDDFDLDEIGDEEIPDYLKGEKVIKI